MAFVLFPKKDPHLFLRGRRARINSGTGAPRVHRARVQAVRDLDYTRPRGRSQNHDVVCREVIVLSLF